MKQHITKLAIVAVTALTLGIGSLVPATAAKPVPNYPLPPCSVTTDSAVYSPGDIAVITGSGGTPGGTITFIITFSGGGAPVQLVGNVGADGTTVVLFEWPDVPGAYTIVAVCQASQSPPTEVDVNPLPETGSDVMNIIRAGSVLMLIGLGLFLVAKIRRREHATA